MSAQDTLGLSGDGDHNDEGTAHLPSGKANELRRLDQEKDARPQEIARDKQGEGAQEKAHRERAKGGKDSSLSGDKGGNKGGNEFNNKDLVSNDTVARCSIPEPSSVPYTALDSVKDSERSHSAMPVL